MGEVNLPEGWTQDTLGSLVTVERGSSPRPIKNFVTEKNGVNWVKIGDTKEGQKYVNSTKEMITEAGALKSRFVGVGDFILSNSMSFGRPYIMAIEGYIHDGWFALRLPGGINSDYFYYLLSSSFVQDQFQLLAVGGVVKNISGDLVRKAILPLPPLAEQKVIADKLDTLLAQVETTKSRLDRIPKILKTFRQSVLAAAVSGKLTEEWRKSNSDEIAAQPIEGKERFKQVLFDNAKNSLPNLPHNWLVIPAALVLHYVTSGSRGWAKYYSNQGALFLRMSNVRYDTTKLDLNDLQYVCLPSSAEGKRSKLELDDLLISITADVGRVARIDREFDEAYINQHLALARPTNEINAEYLATCIASQNIGMKQIQALKRGATKAGLGLDDIRSLAIPFPSIKEQTEIVRSVEELFAFADSIEQKANAALERVNNLTQSILAKAFRGELTADWRAANLELISGENSAEALLAKIKAEREKLKPKKKTRTKE